MQAVMISMSASTAIRTMRHTAERSGGLPRESGREARHLYDHKKEIALTADLEESYPAGTEVSEILFDVRERYQVTGYVQGQEAAFADKDEDGYLKAWTDTYYNYEHGPYFYVTEKGSNTPLQTYEELKRNKSYEVKYGRNSYGDSCSLVETAVNEYGNTCRDTVNNVAIHPAVDYTVKNEAVAAFKAVRGIRRLNRSTMGVPISRDAFPFSGLRSMWRTTRPIP